MIGTLLAPQRLLDRIAAAVNHVLRKDELASAQLRDLAGRLVEIHVLKLGWRICLAIESDGILLATSSIAPPDVALEGRLSDFLAMAQAHRRGDQVPAGKVRIQGDLATVQQLQSAFDALSIDWEATLADAIGMIPARQVARVVEGLMAWLRQTRASVERDASAYLLAEARLIPTAPEIETLGAEVLRLDIDLDRLAARLTRLERKSGR